MAIVGLEGFKPGIFAWFGYILPLQERFRLIREAGFTHTCFWWGDEFEALDGPRENRANLARQTGLVVDNVHFPYLTANDLWADNLAGEALFQGLSQALSTCSESDIPCLVVHPTDGDNPPGVNAVGLERLRRLTDHAERVSVRLALENLHTPDILADIFQAIPSPWLGFCFDSGHDHVFRAPGRDLVNQHGKRLMTLHLHDNDGILDQHRIPGEGQLDWRMLRDKLKQQGYAGCHCLESAKEYPPLEEEPPESYLNRAFESLLRLL